MSLIETSAATLRNSRPMPADRATAPAGCASFLDKCLDRAEQLLALAFFLVMMTNILGDHRMDKGIGASLLILPSEGLVILFLLLRRRACAISRNPGEWLLALAGTCTPMLVRIETAHALVPPLAGATLLLMGMVIQVLAKLVLGRSLGLVPAHRGLKRSGPYRFVRHPMYAGYLLSHLGFVLLNPTLWNLAWYVCCDGIQIFRLLAEERFLARDPQYRHYRTAVRYRLIPGLF